MDEYQPPVDRLLKLGEIDRKEEDWHDYLGMGLGLGHVPDLVRMVEDDFYNEDEDPHRPEVWAQIHAWRALGRLKAEAAIPALVQFLVDQEEDDWFDWATEEVPEVLGMIGPAAIPALSARLEHEEVGRYVTMYMGRSLVEIAKRHPEARDEAVAILTGRLEHAASREPFINACLISNLIDLEARESAGAIERAFAAGVVDDSVDGTWHDVWHVLKLEGEPPPETPPLFDIHGRRIALNPIRQPIIPYPLATPPRQESAPRPVDRKDRNKARKKLEAKAKKGKRR